MAVQYARDRKRSGRNDVAFHTGKMRIYESAPKCFLLLLIMMAVATAVGVAAVLRLYDSAFEQQRERLIETAQSRAHGTKSQLGRSST